jgi:hypothetical protein
VKHVDPLAELREVKDTMFNARVDTDFINSSAYACHLLPVCGFQPLLDEVKEVSCKASSIHRKRSDVVERRSDP